MHLVIGSFSSGMEGVILEAQEVCPGGNSIVRVRVSVHYANSKDISLTLYKYYCHSRSSNETRF